MQGSERITGLKKRIKKTLLRERLLLFTAGLLGSAAGIVIIWVMLSIFAGVIILPVWSKVILLAISSLSVLYQFWKLAFSRLMSGSPELTALKLEQKFPGLKGRLIAALQFSAMDEKMTAGYSGDLMLATLLQAEEKSTGLNFNEIVSAYPFWHNLRNMGLTVVLALALLFVFPGLFSYSYEVYSKPTELVAPPLGFTLVPYPGVITAVKYRDISFGAILKGDHYPDKAAIYYRFTDGNWQKTDMALPKPRHFGPSQGDSLIIATTVKQAKRPLDYYVRVGRITTDIAHIDVVDRPRVTGIKVSLFYPEYTGLTPSVVDENDGNIAAVVGTRANIRIETNLPSAKAEMIFDDSSRAPFEINGLTAEQSLRIEKNRNYVIHLLDKQGEVNPDPIEYNITAVPDEYPVIEVLRPGQDMNLNDNMTVPFLLRISDDYGFSSLVLKYNLVHQGEKGDDKVAVLHFSDKIKTQGEINFNWDVESLGLEPSDYIQYHFELADNDRITGPKVTVSRSYIARLPSLDEIIAQTDREQNENIDQAEDYLKAQKDLADRLQKISRKLEQEQSSGSNSKVAWQHQKEMEEVAQNQENLENKIQESAKKMNEMVNRMEENRTSSREVLEKLAEIQKLYEEVATPEMREARLKLMEALKNMDPKQIQEALKNFQMSQEELMQRLDRTIALLKKIKIENKVNALTEMAREIADKQDKMNKSTSGSKKEQLPNLAPEEKKVREQLDDLKKQTAELRQMLKETDYNKAQDADKFCKAVEQSDANSNMDNMTQNLSQKEQDQAMDQGQKALSKLLSMLDQMQQGQASMCKGGDNEMLAKMRQQIDDINYLANGQKDIIDRTGNINIQSEVLRDLAAQQQTLRESVTGLAREIQEMGKESPFVAAELNNLVNSAMGNMDLSVNRLSDRRGLESRNFQQEALYNLNRAAVRMLDALEKQSSCNKGGQCDKPTQKLNSLCEKQNMLNQQTQSQCNNPKDVSPSNKEAMVRLAAEQDAIRKSLSDLEREFGNSREVLGRLDAISDEMKKIVDELSSGEAGEPTLERQLQVYSRMLDASKTLQRKDFTDQRKAEVGKDITRNSPPALTGEQEQGGANMEDKLRQFMNENYPSEYEQHIKAYFKALIENSGGTGPTPQQ
ncbi:conserved membrane hypothetical protein [Candidatus Zixiibacteriota bacterium]|nr:conserved membrane hypothetical protein [candidate division Zixibacteria bacterium]